MSLNRIIISLLLLTIALTVACGQTPTPQEPTIPVEDYHTQAAQTIVGQMTSSAPAILPTDTVPVSTDTVVPTLTSTDTLVPTNTSLPDDTIEPSITPRPTMQPGFEFKDDFKSNTGWVEEINDDFGFEYVNEAYVIFNNLLNAAIYSVREREFADVYLEVDATKIAGPMDGYYGIVCRFVNPSNYYALVIGSDDFYGFGKMEEGKFEIVENGTADDEVINPDNEVNKIRAECVGENLSLIVNGKTLLEIEDDDFESGAIGLVVGNKMTDTGTEVVFDNYYVLAP